MLAASLVGGIIPAKLLAEEAPWPKARTLRILNGFTAGSATDVVARAVAPALAEALGAHSIIVDNKPGAGGSIAAGMLVAAPSDGYTFLVTSSAHAINPSFYPRLAYDTLRDITAVGPIGSSMFIMVTSPSKKFHSVKDVVEAAKQQPGKLNYGSGGVGSGSHLNSAKLVVTTGMDVVHVPFKGTTEALSDTVAGRMDWMFAPIPAAVSLIKSGRLRALAVGPSERSAILPDVPSMSEAGFPAASYSSWVGMFASSKTPAPILEKASAALAQVVAQPALREQLFKMGTEPMSMNAAQFNRFVRDEVAAMATLVRATGIKVND
nr:tripartite tricarboxylate transporter substrate-binding protein [Caenimonas aquaedulcis]